MKKLYLLILIFFSLSCDFLDDSQSINRFVDMTIEVDSNNVPLKRDTIYFPNEFYDDSLYSYTYIRNNVYSYQSLKLISTYLKDFNEPLLYNIIPDKEIYRLSAVPALTYSYVIRIEKGEQEIKLFYKQAYDYDNKTKTVIYDSVFKEIGIEEWNKLDSLVENADFWDLEYYNKGLGLDGCDYAFEAVNRKKYHVIDRWSPGPPISDIFRYMEKLAEEE